MFKVKSQDKEQLLDGFDDNVFIYRDAMKIKNESIIGKYFGDALNDTPRNIMVRFLEKDSSSVREYYKSNK